MVDYYSVISSAVSSLPNKTVEARRELYDRACNALQENLLALDPPISGNELAKEQLALETAIRRVEEDLLLGIMRRFVREDAPRPALHVILLSTVRDLVSSMEDKLKNAITIVRERLTQSLVFVQKAQLQTKDIGRRIHLRIFGERR
jgi:hypothetical protein